MSREALEPLSIPEQIAVASNLAEVASEFANRLWETLLYLESAELQTAERSKLHLAFFCLEANLELCEDTLRTMGINTQEIPPMTNEGGET